MTQDDLVSTLVLQYADAYEARAVRQELKDLARDIAIRVYGNARRRINTGQGTPMFRESLRDGADQLQKSAVLYLSKDVTLDLCFHMFELAYEEALLQYGDIYTSDQIMAGTPVWDDEDVDDDDDDLPDFL